jgi:hypothetical protein
MSLFLLIAAFILFVLATFGINHPKVNLTSLGLACATLAVLFQGRI